MEAFHPSRFLFWGGETKILAGRTADAGLLLDSRTTTADVNGVATASSPSNFEHAHNTNDVCNSCFGRSATWLQRRAPEHHGKHAQSGSASVRRRPTSAERIRRTVEPLPPQVQRTPDTAERLGGLPDWATSISLDEYLHAEVSEGHLNKQPGSQSPASVQERFAR